MRIFSLTLLVLLSLPVIFACPSLLNASGQMPNSYTIPVGSTIVCNSSQVFDMYENGVPSTTVNLYVAGDLILNGSELRVRDGGFTYIHVNSTGNLVLGNSSSLESPAKTGEVVFTAEAGSTVIIDSSQVYNISELNVSGFLELSEVDFISSGPLSLFNSSSHNSVFINSTNNQALALYDGDYSFMDSEIYGEISIDSSNVSFTDSFLNHSSRMFELVDSELYLYNTTFYKNLFYDNSSVYVYWPVSILVLSELGFPVYDVWVRAYDTYLVKQYEEVTFTDGILQPFLLSYVSNDTTYSYYSNYTINVTDDENAIYDSVSTTVNVSGPLNITLEVQTQKGIVRTGSFCGADRPFCAKKNPVPCSDMKAGDSCPLQFIVNGTDNFDSGTSFLEGFYTFFFIASPINPLVSSVLSKTVNVTFSR